MLSGFEDKSATAMTIFAYLEEEHAEPVLFFGKTDGSIVSPRGTAQFGWDSNFEEKSTGLTYPCLTQLRGDVARTETLAVSQRQGRPRAAEVLPNQTPVDPCREEAS